MFTQHDHPPEEVCVDCAPFSDDSAAGTMAAASPLGEAASTSGVAAVSVAQVAGDGEIVPPGKVYPALTIEYCDRCRWAPRSTWYQTELLLTFPTPVLRSITLIPHATPDTGGQFRVWLDRGNGDELVWDRKTEGGFPDLKVLKSKVRNLIQPERGLGHSEVHNVKASETPHGHKNAP